MDTVSGMDGRISINIMKFDSDIFDAVTFGDLDSVQMYWSDEIDIDYQDKFGMTLLMYASMYGWSEIIDYLLKYQPDVTLCDYKGETAIDKSYNRDVKAKLLHYFNGMK